MTAIIIAEDDFLVRKNMVVALTKFDPEIKIYQATDGQEAIDHLKLHNVELLVTDLKMPQVDGLALLAYVNNHHKRLPCLITSGHAGSLKEFRRIVRALEPEIDAAICQDHYKFMSKPFRLTDFTATVSELLALNGLDRFMKGISPAGFAQLIEGEAKTCVLKVVDGAGEAGYMFFEEGDLYHARKNNLTGDEAAVAILNIKEPYITIQDNLNTAKYERSIDTGLMALILEASKRKDESGFVSEVE